MQVKLNVVDAFSAAIKLEERGVGFYAEAANRFSGASQNLLMLLSGM